MVFKWFDHLKTIYKKEDHLKKYGFFHCSKRNIHNIEKKYKKDFIWVIWEIIIKESIVLLNILQWCFTIRNCNTKCYQY